MFAETFAELKLTYLDRSLDSAKSLSDLLSPKVPT